jgi:hypothetical protein
MIRVRVRVRVRELVRKARYRFANVTMCLDIQTGTVPRVAIDDRKSGDGG